MDERLREGEAVSKDDVFRHLLFSLTGFLPVLQDLLHLHGLALELAAVPNANDMSEKLAIFDISHLQVAMTVPDAALILTVENDPPIV